MSWPRVTAFWFFAGRVLVSLAVVCAGCAVPAVADGTDLPAVCKTSHKNSDGKGAKGKPLHRSFTSANLSMAAYAFD